METPVLCDTKKQFHIMPTVYSMERDKGLDSNQRADCVRYKEWATSKAKYFQGLLMWFPVELCPWAATEFLEYFVTRKGGGSLYF